MCLGNAILILVSLKQMIQSRLARDINPRLVLGSLVYGSIQQGFETGFKVFLRS